MINFGPLNTIAINDFRQSLLIGFNDNINHNEDLAAYYSLVHSDSFLLAGEQENWQSLVESEGVTLQAALEAQFTFNMALSSGIAFADESKLRTLMALSSSLVIDGALHIDPGLVFDVAEGLVFTGVSNTKLRALVSIAESLTALSSCDLTIAHSIAESLNLAGDAVTEASIVLALVESMVLSGDSDTTLTAAMDLVESIVITGNISETLKAAMFLSSAIVLEAEASSAVAIGILESMGIAVDADLSTHAVLNVFESILLDEAMESAARITFAPMESLSLDDALDIKAVLAIAFNEGIDFVGVINTPEGEYTAWVLNTETRAPWRYDNFPFISYANTGSSYLAITDAGLYELTGKVDDGTPIESMWKTGLINFGSAMKKSMPRGYFGYTTSGKLLFKTITTDTGKKIERWYELKERTADEVTDARVKMARGVKSVYWQFEVINIEGADFEIDNIQLLPAILNRRV